MEGSNRERRVLGGGLLYPELKMWCDVMMNASEVGKSEGGLPLPPILRTRTVKAPTFTLHRQQAGRE